MSEKDDELDDLELGDDDDMDLDDMDFDMDMGDMGDIDPSTREPAGIVSDTATSFRESFTDDKLETIVEVAKAAIPDKLSEESDAVANSYDSITETIATNKAAITKDARRTLKNFKKLLPGDNGGTLGGIVDKVTGFLGDDEESYGSSQGPTQAERIASEVANMMGAKQEGDDLKEAIQQQVAEYQARTEHDLNANIALNTERMRKYAFEVTDKYYRSMLDVNLRQLYNIEELVSVTKAGFDIFKGSLEAITKNTGLPDAVKINNMEIAEVRAKERMVDAIGTGLFGNSNPIEKITKAVTATIKGATGVARDYLDTANGAVEGLSAMTPEETGQSAGGMAGGMAGGLLGSFVQAMIGKSLGKLAQKNDTVNTGIRNVKDAFADIPHFLKKVVRDDGLLSSAADVALGTIGSDRKSIKIERSNPDAATFFDNRTKDSINKVIPMLLSKIHSELANGSGVGSGGSRSTRAAAAMAKRKHDSELIYDHHTGELKSRKEHLKGFKERTDRSTKDGYGSALGNVIHIFTQHSKQGFTREELTVLRDHVADEVLKGGRTSSSLFVDGKFLRSLDKDSPGLSKKVKAQKKFIESDKLKEIDKDLWYSIDGQLNSSLARVKTATSNHEALYKNMYESGMGQDLIDSGIGKRNDRGEFEIDSNKHRATVIDQIKSIKLETPAAATNVYTSRRKYLSALMEWNKDNAASMDAGNGPLPEDTKPTLAKGHYTGGFTGNTPMSERARAAFSDLPGFKNGGFPSDPGASGVSVPGGNKKTFPVDNGSVKLPVNKEGAAIDPETGEELPVATIHPEEFVFSREQLKKIFKMLSAGDAKGLLNEVTDMTKTISNQSTKFKVKPGSITKVMDTVVSGGKSAANTLNDKYLDSISDNMEYISTYFGKLKNLNKRSTFEDAISTISTKAADAYAEAGDKISSALAGVKSIGGKAVTKLKDSKEARTVAKAAASNAVGDIQRIINNHTENAQEYLELVDNVTAVLDNKKPTGSDKEKVAATVYAKAISRYIELKKLDTSEMSTGDLIDLVGDELTTSSPETVNDLVSGSHVEKAVARMDGIIDMATEAYGSTATAKAISSGGSKKDVYKAFHKDVMSGKDAAAARLRQTNTAKAYEAGEGVGGIAKAVATDAKDASVAVAARGKDVVDAIGETSVGKKTNRAVTKAKSAVENSKLGSAGIETVKSAAEAINVERKAVRVAEAGAVNAKKILDNAEKDPDNYDKLVNNATAIMSGKSPKGDKREIIAAQAYAGAITKYMVDHEDDVAGMPVEDVITKFGKRALKGDAKSVARYVKHMTGSDIGYNLIATKNAAMNKSRNVLNEMKVKTIGDTVSKVTDSAAGKAVGKGIGTALDKVKEKVGDKPLYRKISKTADKIGKSKVANAVSEFKSEMIDKRSYQDHINSVKTLIKPSDIPPRAVKIYQNIIATGVNSRRAKQFTKNVDALLNGGLPVGKSSDKYASAIYAKAIAGLIEANPRMAGEYDLLELSDIVTPNMVHRGATKVATAAKKVGKGTKERLSKAADVIKDAYTTTDDTSDKTEARLSAERKKVGVSGVSIKTAKYISEELNAGPVRKNIVLHNIDAAINGTDMKGDKEARDMAKAYGKAINKALVRNPELADRDKYSIEDLIYITAPSKMRKKMVQNKDKVKDAILSKASDFNKLMSSKMGLELGEDITKNGGEFLKEAAEAYGRESGWDGDNYVALWDDFSDEDKKLLKLEFFASEEYKLKLVTNFALWLRDLKHIDPGSLGSKTGLMLGNIFKLKSKTLGKISSLRDEVIEETIARMNGTALKELTLDQETEMRAAYFSSPEHKEGLVTNFDEWLAASGYRRNGTGIFGRIKKNLNPREIFKRTRKFEQKIFGKAIKGVAKGVAKAPYGIVKGGAKLAYNTPKALLYGAKFGVDRARGINKAGDTLTKAMRATGATKLAMKAGGTLLGAGGKVLGYGAGMFTDAVTDTVTAIPGLGVLSKNKRPVAVASIKMAPTRAKIAAKNAANAAVKFVDNERKDLISGANVVKNDIIKAGEVAVGAGKAAVDTGASVGKTALKAGIIAGDAAVRGGKAFKESFEEGNTGDRIVQAGLTKARDTKTAVVYGTKAAKTAITAVPGHVKDKAKVAELVIGGLADSDPGLPAEPKYAPAPNKYHIVDTDRKEMGERKIYDRSKEMMAKMEDGHKVTSATAPSKEDESGRAVVTDPNKAKLERVARVKARRDKREAAEEARDAYVATVKSERPPLKKLVRKNVRSAVESFREGGTSAVVIGHTIDGMYKAKDAVAKPLASQAGKIKGSFGKEDGLGNKALEHTFNTIYHPVDTAVAVKNAATEGAAKGGERLKESFAESKLGSKLIEGKDGLDDRLKTLTLAISDLTSVEKTKQTVSKLGTESDKTLHVSSVNRPKPRVLKERNLAAMAKIIPTYDDAYPIPYGAYGTMLPGPNTGLTGKYGDLKKYDRKTKYPDMFSESETPLSKGGTIKDLIEYEKARDAAKDSKEALAEKQKRLDAKAAKKAAAKEARHKDFLNQFPSFDDSRPGKSDPKSKKGWFKRLGKLPFKAKLGVGVGAIIAAGMAMKALGYNLHDIAEGAKKLFSVLKGAVHGFTDTVKMVLNIPNYIRKAMWYVEDAVPFHHADPAELAKINAALGITGPEKDKKDGNDSVDAGGYVAGIAGAGYVGHKLLSPVVKGGVSIVKGGVKAVGAAQDIVAGKDAPAKPKVTKPPKDKLLDRVKGFIAKIKSRLIKRLGARVAAGFITRMLAKVSPVGWLVTAGLIGYYTFTKSSFGSGVSMALLGFDIFSDDDDIPNADKASRTRDAGSYIPPTIDDPTSQGQRDREKKRKDAMDAIRKKSASSAVDSILNSGAEGEKDAKGGGGGNSGGLRYPAIPVDKTPIVEGRIDSLTLSKDAIVDRLNPAVLKNLLGMATEYENTTGKKLYISEGFRTRERQIALKKKYGKGAASPGHSTHEFGLALDIPGKAADHLEELGLMRKYGFTRPVGKEPWHIEPALIQGNVSRARGDEFFATDAAENSIYHGGGGYGTQPKARQYGRDKNYQAALYMGNEKVIKKTAVDNVIDLAKAKAKMTTPDRQAATKTAAAMSKRNTAKAAPSPTLNNTAPGAGGTTTPTPVITMEKRPATAPASPIHKTAAEVSAGTTDSVMTHKVDVNTRVSLDDSEFMKSISESAIRSVDLQQQMVSVLGAISSKMDRQLEAKDTPQPEVPPTPSTIEPMPNPVVSLRRGGGAI